MNTNHKLEEEKRAYRSIPQSMVYSSTTTCNSTTERWMGNK